MKTIILKCCYGPQPYGVFFGADNVQALSELSRVPGLGQYSTQAEALEAYCNEYGPGYELDKTTGNIRLTTAKALW